MAQITTMSTDQMPPRRAENTERFVAFAFAAADLVVEIETDGQITYAAGAFRARLGEQPESFIGRRVHALISPIDHPALDAALLLLREKGRLSPLTVRLAARGGPQFALAGLALASVDASARYCLTFAQAAAPLTNEQPPSPEAFARMGMSRIRENTACGLGLVEVANPSPASSEAMRQALHTVAPNAVTSELAPGRFGVLGGEGSAGLPTVLKMLEESLRSSTGADIATHQFSLPAEGLTSTQAARALGQALIVFARAGQEGLSGAGFKGGLAGYVDKAAGHSAALRRAIKERRFELLYQPIMSLEHRTLHHYEALMRPAQPLQSEFGSPQEFVILTETLGVAGELDLAVAEMACAAAAKSSVPIAFNVSGQSIQDPKFRDRLLAVLAASPACRAGRLMIEMTETAEVQDLAEAARTAEALRAMKVPFCLDDFGAGTADVRVLRSLPADTVKLDGSFVPGVVAGGRERGFVTGIIEIARAAGATVVAERIETEVEAAALRAAGACYGQGWLFGKPGPLPARPQGTTGRRMGERESWG